MAHAGACALLLAGLASAVPARAELFKCVGADGRTSYQAEPCVAATREERIAVPAGKESPMRPPKPTLQPGWDRGEVNYVSDTCIQASFHAAQHEYNSHPHSPTEPFDERTISGPVSAHCWCLANQAATKWLFSTYSRNPLGAMNELTEASYQGGACKPDGKYAEFLRRTGRMP